MGRLFHTERGRMLAHNNEELSRWRWVRKVFKLPAAAAGHPAELWLNLCEYENNHTPLDVLLNGHPLGQLPAQRGAQKFWYWYKLDIPAKKIRTGENRFELRANSPAMNAWTLAIEPGHAEPHSFISTDQGKKWRNHGMGAHNILRGEYLIRLHSLAPKIKPDKPPRILYEDPAHPRVKELLQLIPEDIRAMRDPWEQLLKLRTWQSTAWSHSHIGQAYAPWDPWTILDWTRRTGAHALPSRIAMCVHFGSMFAAMLTSLGHKARCIINTTGLSSGNGHFMTEVWSKRHKKWVLHDGNLDLHYEADGVPLSAFDLADRCDQGLLPLNELIRVGPGYHRQPPHVSAFNEKLALPGIGWRHTGVWLTNNYISDPTSAPPTHGSVTYCETDILWYNPRGHAPAPMFPYTIADRKELDRAPN